LGTGAYASSGDCSNPTNAYDEDWDTFGIFVSDPCYIYINYTKMDGDEPSSLWQIKDGEGTWMNLSITEACYNYDADKLMFRLTSEDSGGPKERTGYDCYDGTWIELHDVDSTTTSGELYEEAMWWNYTPSDFVTATAISPDSDSFTNAPVDINFTFKCVGSSVSYYANISINGTQNTTEIPTQNNTNTVQQINDFLHGNYSWIVSCYNDSVSTADDSDTLYFEATNGSVTANVISPDSQTFYNAPVDINFTFNCTGTSPSYLANISINDTLNVSDIAVNNNTNKIQQIDDFQHGNYSWNVVCWNSTHNTEDTSSTLYFEALDPYVSANAMTPDDETFYDPPLNVTFTFNCTGSLDSYHAAIFVNGTENHSFLESCYQETTNTSNPSDGDCGLVYTGAYAFEGNWVNSIPSYDVSYTYDGNWSTYGRPARGDNSTFYANYSKPTLAMSAMMQMKDGSASTGTENVSNITIPDSCFQQSNLQIKIFLDEKADPDTSIYYCHNGTGWETIAIHQYLRAYWLFEEGIYWGIPIEVSNNTNTSVDIEIDDIGEYSWYVMCWNGSTTDNSSYLDFNITYTPDTVTAGAISPNATVFYDMAVNVTFTFNCTGSMDSYYANVTTNGSINWTDIAALNDTNTQVESNFSNGFYVWNVTCYNVSGYPSGVQDTSVTLNFTMNDTPPSIELLYPANGSHIVSTAMFGYIPTDTSGNGMDCSIYLNTTLNATNSSISNGTTIDNIITGLNNSHSPWHVNCTDSSGQTNVSEDWTFNMTSALSACDPGGGGGGGGLSNSLLVYLGLLTVIGLIIYKAKGDVK
jgi:hypothetical protein